jgi:hypothetical protein
MTMTPRLTTPDVGFTGPADPDWGYVLIGTDLVCGRCGLVIGKVGPHMDWHRWLDEQLDTRPSEGVPSFP